MTTQTRSLKPRLSKRTFRVGQSYSRLWTVSPAMLYAPGDDPSRATLSSPSLIHEMEITAVDALRGKMPEEAFTVGYHVDVKHLAPSPLGARIQTTAKLIEVKGDKLKFYVEARDVDTWRLVGIGTHRRAVIHP